MVECESMGNEVTLTGIVHRCSCGWVSRPCFSNAVAPVLGAEHRAGTENDRHLTAIHEAARMLQALGARQIADDLSAAEEAFRALNIERGRREG